MPVSSSTERILVIRHGAFGDVMQTEGALHDLRDHHPAAEITALTTPAYRRIFERCPWIDRVLLDPRAPHWRLDRMMSLRAQMRAERFDKIYDLQNSTRTDFYRRWIFSGQPWSGRRQQKAGPFRFKASGLSPFAMLAEQLEAAGVPLKHTPEPDLSWMAEDVSTLLAGAGVTAPLITLVPGSSVRHPQKRWPYYPELAEALLARGFVVVTAPGPDEIDLARTIPGTTLTGPYGALDWFQLAGLFARSVFVIGNDTGPSHLAAHSGAPGVALFGPHTSPDRTGIRRTRFDAIAVADLRDLGWDRVLRHVESRLAQAPAEDQGAGRTPSTP